VIGQPRFEGAHEPLGDAVGTNRQLHPIRPERRKASGSPIPIIR
jgi:hypothetical protein